MNMILIEERAYEKLTSQLIHLTEMVNELYKKMNPEKEK